jgi:hypothetical protein
VHTTPLPQAGEGVAARPGRPGRISDVSADSSLVGLRVGDIAEDPLPAPTGTRTLYLDDKSMHDVSLALTWGGPGKLRPASSLRVRESQFRPALRVPTVLMRDRRAATLVLGSTR